MRIIHVNLAKGFRGGERQTVILIRALEELGVEQTLVCRKGSPMISELEANACKIYPVNKPLLSAFTSKELGKDRHVLVHAHEAKASQWAYLFKLFTNTPYIITRRIQKRPGYSWLTQKVYKSAKTVVSISSSVANTMSSYLADLNSKSVGFKPVISKSVVSQSIVFQVIPDACALLKASDGGTALKESYPDKFIIGHIGALSIAEKGQDLIIEAAKKIEDKLPQLQFVLIGEGKDRAELESQAAELTNVDFLGFRSDIGELLAGMDAFVFPSRHEGLGSSLLDALSFKLPIIASDIPGITDIIQDRENGLLVAKDNGQALAAAIEEIVINQSLRELLESKAVNSLKPFMPTEVASSYLQLYKDLSQNLILDTK